MSKEFENNSIEDQFDVLDEHLLYCGQDANFQTRTMLIPKKLLTEKRLNDWKKMKSSSKEIVEIQNGFLATVEHKSYGLGGNCMNEEFMNSLSEEQKTIYSICLEFTMMADGLCGDCDDYYYFDKEDYKWYTKTIINLGKGFDHYDTFKDLMNLKHHKGRPIKILEGILCLETLNGKIKEQSKIKSTGELLYKYYLKNEIPDADDTEFEKKLEETKK